MIVMDELRILVGLPLTSEEERQFGSACVRDNNAASTTKSSERFGRLQAQQVEHDHGKVDLKGVGDNFCAGATGEVTRQSLNDEIRRIQRTKGIVWRESKEAIAKSRTDYRDACRTAKSVYRTTNRDAKLAYARSVSGLLKVEQQARGVALDTYNQVTKSASSTLSSTYSSLLSTRQQARERIVQSTAGTLAMLDNQIEELRVDILGLTLDKRYKRIDMGFLRMRQSTGGTVGLPLFAVFTPTKPNFDLVMRVKKREGSETIYQTMTCSRKSVAQYYHAFAGCMRGHVDKHVERCWSGYRKWTHIDVTLSVTAGFAGVIPATVRKKIQVAQPDFDEILIVTESPKWALQFEDRSYLPVPVGDPLVIGRKGKGFWLIDSFDTTPAEDYVRREFTSDKK